MLAVIDQLKARGLPAPQAVSLGGMPDALTGLKTGQTDAAFAVPPLFFDQIEKGDLRIVIRGNEIQKFNDVTIRVTFANASFAEKNPTSVEARSLWAKISPCIRICAASRSIRRMAR